MCKLNYLTGRVAHSKIAVKGGYCYYYLKTFIEKVLAESSDCERARRV